jgi:putative transposase
MARIPRRRLGRGVYHVLNRAYDRQFIFDNDSDKAYLLSLLHDQGKKYQLNIYHWVIMSNHFHLAIEILKVEELSRYVGKVCELYSRYWRRKYGGCGTLWQGRFKSMTVQKEGYLNRLGRYIERNPVAANLCDVPWDYPWSSAKAYVSGSNDNLVHIEHLLNYMHMGSESDERVERYKSYLLSEREIWQSDAELFGSSAPAVGDDMFIAQAVSKSGRLTSRRVGRPRKV